MSDTDFERYLAAGWDDEQEDAVPISPTETAIWLALIALLTLSITALAIVGMVQVVRWAAP